MNGTMSSDLLHMEVASARETGLIEETAGEQRTTSVHEPTVVTVGPWTEVVLLNYQYTA